MNEKIRTSFASNEFEQMDPEKGLVAIEKFLSASEEIKPFSSKEEAKAIEFLEKAQESMVDKTKKPILHIAFGAKLSNDGKITNSIPEKIKNDFYEKAIIIPNEEMDKLSEDRKKILETEPQNFIVVSNNGEITAENWQKLNRLLKDRTGIIIGGGAHSPEHPKYRPLIKAMENLLENEPTTVGGICMGHELMAMIMGFLIKNEWHEQGPTVEEITKNGQNDPIFSRFGKSIEIAMLHEYAVVFTKEEKYQALSKSAATGETGSVRYLEKGSSIYTIQGHPEFGLGVKKGEPILTGPFDVEIAGKAIRILEPGQQAHKDIKQLVEYYIEDYDNWSKKLQNFSLNDIQKMFNPNLLKPALTKDFFGPLIMQMAKNKLKI